ncbi:uncharacterized protein LOC129730705 [Wyeomyia smithii]|uniref:uncharacterized protein LOC129730705 n=1 Tax=Wyeomyia smithii TaxID=174621 RepID=UPI002467D66F|nr:uncharacterized protein LOC129730705 [Wyeomyia smithii]
MESKLDNENYADGSRNGLESAILRHILKTIEESSGEVVTLDILCTKLGEAAPFQSISPENLRHLIDEELEAAVLDGLVTEEDDQYRLAENNDVGQEPSDAVGDYPVPGRVLASTERRDSPVRQRQRRSRASPIIRAPIRQRAPTLPASDRRQSNDTPIRGRVGASAALHAAAPRRRQSQSRSRSPRRRSRAGSRSRSNQRRR